MNETNKNENWNYQNNLLWNNNFPLCGASSREQSPINIDSSNVTDCDLLCQLKFESAHGTCGVKYENNTIKVNYGQGSSIEFNGINYMLEANESIPRPAISIHIPSLHTIDNQRFDIEIVMVYKGHNENEDSPDNGVIISRFANRKGGNYGPIQDFLSQFIYDIPDNVTTNYNSVEVSPTWSVKYLEPTSKAFYSYKGSLPYPPCWKNYTWILFSEVGNIGEESYQIIKDNIGSNIRPLQKLYNRTISYNNGEKILTSSSVSHHKISNNKFLKCIKRKVIEQPEVTTEVTTEETIDESGLSQNTINTIYNILLTVIIIILLILANFLVKYLYKHMYIQKWIRTLGGSQNISKGVFQKWKETQLVDKNGKLIDSGLRTNTRNPSKIGQYSTRFGPPRANSIYDTSSDRSGYGRWGFERFRPRGY